MSASFTLTTFTGKVIAVDDPDPALIDLTDIAHALSLQCRWNGMCRRFFSVAQHSLLVSTLVAPEHRRWALLHDAAEAYVGDCIRPIRALLPTFDAIEARFLQAIVKAFDLPWPIPPEVWAADNRALCYEAKYLMSAHPDLAPSLAARFDIDPSLRPPLESGFVLTDTTGPKFVAARFIRQYEHCRHAEVPTG